MDSVNWGDLAWWLAAFALIAIGVSGIVSMIRDPFPTKQSDHKQVMMFVAFFWLPSLVCIVAGLAHFNLDSFLTEAIERVPGEIIGTIAAIAILFLVGAIVVTSVDAQLSGRGSSKKNDRQQKIEKAKQGKSDEKGESDDESDPK